MLGSWLGKLGYKYWLGPPFLAGDCCVCGWAWVSACTPPFLAGVLGRAWLFVRSACTPPFLARVCGVGVCALAPVSAALRHPRLECSGVCVFVCALRLHPATPGWGVRCRCVCLGSGFGCAPPLLAWVLGSVFVCVRAQLVPRHSWLGCAVWVCGLGPRFGLRPATPGPGVGVCVCLCARSAWSPAGPGWGVRCGRVCLGWGVGCALLLLAGVLGCACVLCALCLYPDTPGPGVGCGCVCLGSGLGCAPPLLGGVCVCVRAPLVLCYSWLGCAVWLCVLELGFLVPPCHSWLECLGVCVFVCALSLCFATRGWVVRCGFVCLGSVFGCTLPLLAGVLGCVCVFVCALSLYPATAGWVLRCRCVCLGSRCGGALPLLVGVLGCVCVCVRALLGPLPLFAGVCSVGVCAWARSWAAPRHSWLGCWGVCVIVCTLRWYPATPGWCVQCGFVCLGSGFACASPLLNAVLGCVCVCVRAPLVPGHPWHGCAVWACVLGFGALLRPATPGWGVVVCVCLCARSACTPPLVARGCGDGVCVSARVSAAPRHSWLGCSGVCVCLCARSAWSRVTPGWGLRCGCVCLGAGLGCALPLLAGVLGCVFLFARSVSTPPLLARVCGVGVCAWARVSAAPCHSWLGVCLVARSACTPLFLAGVCAVGVCALSRVAAAPPHSWLGCWGVCVLGCTLVLRYSWLGCAVCVCVLWRGSRLRPATPDWGVGVCVCLCARSVSTPPLLAGVCGVGVCAWSRVAAAPRHCWLGCWGVCVFVCALRLYPATPG